MLPTGTVSLFTLCVKHHVLVLPKFYIYGETDNGTHQEHNRLVIVIEV